MQASNGAVSIIVEGVVDPSGSNAWGAGDHRAAANRQPVITQLEGRSADQSLAGRDRYAVHARPAADAHRTSAMQEKKLDYSGENDARYAVRACSFMAVPAYVRVPVAVQAAGSASGGTNWCSARSMASCRWPARRHAPARRRWRPRAANGCNRFTTTYTASRSTISFAAPGASTMMACRRRDAAGGDYMAALAAANRYQLRGGQLILLDGTTVLATSLRPRQTWLAPPAE